MFRNFHQFLSKLDLFSSLIGFLVRMIIFSGSVAICCAVGFALFRPSQRLKQLGVSLGLIILLHLASFHLVVWEWPFLYSILVLASCVVLGFHLLDSTDSMVFSLIRSVLMLLIATLVLLYLLFLGFAFVVWLSDL